MMCVGVIGWASGYGVMPALRQELLTVVAQGPLNGRAAGLMYADVKKKFLHAAVVVSVSDHEV